MKKQKAFLLIILGLFLSCETQNTGMDIRNTSINDYQANYIFNIENTINALKKMNDFALKDIKEQKHFIDSIKKETKANNKPISFEERLNSTTLSTSPEDIIFYTPPETLSDRVREKDIVLHYALNPKTFAIKNITVGNRYTNNNTAIEAILDNNNCTLVINEKEFTLNTLHNVLQKVEHLQFQNKAINFNYTVKNKDNKEFLDIIYKDKGTSLLLNYN